MGFTENTFHRASWLVLALALLVPAQQAKAAPKVIECTVILDQETGGALVRNGTCDERFTPMSTFKVPLALIGYDAGLLEDEHTPRWDYEPKFNAPKRTHKTVDPTIWEEESILWYSQELTRKLGKAAFEGYVARLGYGNADTGGRPGEDDGLTQSWLSSSLMISPDEQAAFMRRIVARDLPIRPAAIDMTVRIIPAFESGGWHVQGKTGSGWLRRKNGKFDYERPVGWFVGWAQKDGRKIAFAQVRVDNKKADERSGLAMRDDFLKELPALIGGK